MSLDKASALVWDAERLRTATDAAGVCLWSWNVDTDEIAMDERAIDLWGVSHGGAVTFEHLSAHIHPEDLYRVRSAFAETRNLIGPYEVDFRILLGGSTRWVSARGQGADDGIVGRVMFGIFMDVTARKQAEETREMIANEMSHRVKNLFSIASALTVIASRSAANTTEMARDLTQRLTALGLAHDLVRPKAGGRKVAPLADLMAVLLAPYGEEGATDRFKISIPHVQVGETAATTLALIVHELATNSIKYGALSVAAGSLDVSCTEQNEDVVVTWTENGGPSVTAPTRHSGFGTKLISQSLSGQLGGSIKFDWRPLGVAVTFRMRKSRLAS